MSGICVARVYPQRRPLLLVGARINVTRSMGLRALAATAFGLGYLPLAPATWASAAAALPFLMLERTAGGKLMVSTTVLALAILIVIALGLALAPWAERHWGRKDPGEFVLDEVAGMWLVGLLCPHAFLSPASSGPLGVALGFIAFRVFDVAKPWPIRRIERLPGGGGIMLDDLMAAVYAAALLWGARGLGWI